MKLELKHLAPYLPYGLKVVDDEQNVGYLRALYDDCLLLNYDINVGDYEFNFEDIKPLLIPLSEFNNSDADNEIFERGQLYSSVTLNEMSEFPYWQMEILFKHHFDVFGLIDAGLALNKLNY